MAFPLISRIARPLSRAFQKSKAVLTRRTVAARPALPKAKLNAPMRSWSTQPCIERGLGMGSRQIRSAGVKEGKGSRGSFSAKLGLGLISLFAVILTPFVAIYQMVSEIFTFKPLSKPTTETEAPILFDYLSKEALVKQLRAPVEQQHTEVRTFIKAFILVQKFPNPAGDFTAPRTPIATEKDIVRYLEEEHGAQILHDYYRKFKVAQEAAVMAVTRNERTIAEGTTPAPKITISAPKFPFVPKLPFVPK